MAPGGLYARNCHAFLVQVLLHRIRRSMAHRRTAAAQNRRRKVAIDMAPYRTVPYRAAWRQDFV